MRTKMKQIIDGKLYDTETADVVASNDYWDGSNLERGGRNKHLYKTQKGNFFVGYSTQWQGELDYIEVVSESMAKELYEQLPVHQTEYDDAFGIQPEIA